MYIGQSIANNMSYGNNSVGDVQLKQYIDQVMARYDTNRNGTLEAHELTRFFNDLFQMCGIPRRIAQWEAMNFMRQVDTNFDRKANKFELFRAFKLMMANQGGCSGGYNNGYQSEWSPNFGGYAPATSVGFGGFGGGYRVW